MRRAHFLPRAEGGPTQGPGASNPGGMAAPPPSAECQFTTQRARAEISAPLGSPCSLPNQWPHPQISAPAKRTQVSWAPLGAQEKSQPASSHPPPNSLGPVHRGPWERIRQPAPATPMKRPPLARGDPGPPKSASRQEPELRPCSTLESPGWPRATQARRGEERGGGISSRPPSLPQPPTEVSPWIPAPGYPAGASPSTGCVQTTAGLAQAVSPALPGPSRHRRGCPGAQEEDGEEAGRTSRGARGAARGPRSLTQEGRQRGARPASS